MTRNVEHTRQQAIHTKWSVRDSGGFNLSERTLLHPSWTIITGVYCDSMFLPTAIGRIASPSSFLLNCVGDAPSFYSARYDGDRIAAQIVQRAVSKLRNPFSLCASFEESIIWIWVGDRLELPPADPLRKALIVPHTSLDWKACQAPKNILYRRQRHWGEPQKTGIGCQIAKTEEAQ